MMMIMHDDHTSYSSPYSMNQIFDKRTGGLGASEALFENKLSLLRRGFELLTTCPCALGCPACILDNRCDMTVAGER